MIGWPALYGRICSEEGNGEKKRHGQGVAERNTAQRTRWRLTAFELGLCVGLHGFRYAGRVATPSNDTKLSDGGGLAQPLRGRGWRGQQPQGYRYGQAPRGAAPGYGTPGYAAPGRRPGYAAPGVAPGVAYGPGAPAPGARYGRVVGGRCSCSACPTCGTTPAQTTQSAPAPTPAYCRCCGQVIR